MCLHLVLNTGDDLDDLNSRKEIVARGPKAALQRISYEHLVEQECLKNIS